MRSSISSARQEVSQTGEDSIFAARQRRAGHSLSMHDHAKLAGHYQFMIVLDHELVLDPAWHSHARQDIERLLSHCRLR